MPPFRRIVMAQACAIAVTIAAGAAGGLIATSWIWAIACAVVMYALSQAAVLAWAAWWTITRRRGRALDRLAAGDQAGGPPGRA
jgi:hypothetical protein